MRPFLAWRRSRWVRPGPFFAVVAALLAIPATAPAQAPADNRSSRTHYEIEATLDAETKQLTCSETLAWTNTSEDTVADLWFHLYLNAFSNNASTHLSEAHGVLRGATRDGGRRSITVEDGWGWQQVTSIRIGDQELVASMVYQQPDDNRTQDRSVFSVILPEPAAPGATVEATIEWISQLPKVRRRTGYKDDFLYVAQWYPKLGVYEGGKGWNCHQFHSNSEFYADFGTFDVTLDLPERYRDEDGGIKVGASGVRVSPRVSGEAGRVRVRFQAPGQASRSGGNVLGGEPLVHDFAWTADPRYVIEQEKFRYVDWAQRFPDEVQRIARALDKDPSDLDLRSVEVNVFIHPERHDQWRRHYEATCTALFFYGLWFGEYPYDQITVVDPAWGGGAAGGMEYPMIFTCGTRYMTREAMHRPESVTLHEAGHQFWYGLVGNNEFEAAWMDEGFNSFADSEALYLRYGERRSATYYSGIPKWGVRPTALPAGGALGDWLTGAQWSLPSMGGFKPALQPLASSGFIDLWRDQPWLTFVERTDDPRWGDRTGYLRDPDSDPVATSAWEYVDRNSYRTNSYPRPAVALRTLAAVVGQDAFVRGMRHYSLEWRYRHPYPDDFFKSFNEGSGQDVSWYFEDLFRGTATLDWSVSVSQDREAEIRGAFQAQVGGEFLIADKDQEPATSEEERPWIFDVVVRRKGTLRLPCRIEVNFEDGGKRTFDWSREDQALSTWYRLPLDAGMHKVTSVVIDPERLCYLDTDMSDNQWHLEEDELLPLRWSERVLTQYAHLLHWFAATGG